MVERWKNGKWDTIEKKDGRMEDWKDGEEHENPLFRRSNIPLFLR
jgi:hypothetical protein